MSIWIFFVFIIMVTFVGLGYRLIVKKNSSVFLSSRDALSNDEIFRRFYSSSNFQYAEVVELWHEIAVALEVNPEHMRPEDRFGKEVGAYWFTSEELDALGAIAQQRAKRQGRSVDLTALKTVDDYVRHFAAT